MTATTADYPDTVNGEEGEPRRRRLLIWLPLGLLLLGGLIAAASLLEPAHPDRFRGAHGITVREQSGEPMWWADLIVVSPTTAAPASTDRPSPPSTTTPNEAADTPEPTTPPTTAPTAPSITVVAPGDALFGSGSNQLLSESSAALSDSLDGIVADGVVSHAAVRCYTDDLGSVDYNDSLSQSRADAIEQVLVAVGVAPEVIDAQGLGISYTYDNGSETGRARNRRCEIELSVTS